MAVPAARLGLVHGGVGLPEQVVGRAPAGDREGHPDARREEDLPAAHLDRGRQRRGDPPGHLHGPVLATHVLQQHGELVPAQARDRVPGPQAAADAPCRLEHLALVEVRDLGGPD